MGFGSSKDGSNSETVAWCGAEVESFLNRGILERMPLPLDEEDCDGWYVEADEDVAAPEMGDDESESVVCDPDCDSIGG